MNGQRPDKRKSEKRKEGGQKKSWVQRGLILLVLICLIGGGSYYYWQSKQDDSGIRIGANVKKGTPGKKKATKSGKNGTSAASIHLNARPTFETSQSEGDLDIINSEVNGLDMEVVIRLKETDEVIYQSGLIPPGHYIGEASLEKELSKGEHAAIASLTLKDPDNPEQLFNQSNFNLIITIQN